MTKRQQNAADLHNGTESKASQLVDLERYLYLRYIKE